jgi:hypothetical protein
MNSKILLINLFGIIAVSYSTVKSGTAKSKDIVGIDISHKPVVADLDMNQQKTSKTIILQGIECLEAAKNEAIRALLKENSADLIIEPKFETITKNRKTELTINCWLAYYKNFRTIEEKDIKLLEIHPGKPKARNVTTPFIY